MGLKIGKNIQLTWGGIEILNESKPTNEILRNKIVERQLYRFNADIGKWRQALTAAESVHTPQRAELMRVFQEVTLDSHLSALWQSRLSAIMSHKFDLIDSDGEVSDKSDLLQKEWFSKLIKYSSESLLYGYTLIELDDLDNFEFKSVCSIKREYVEPNTKLFKKEYYLQDGIPFLDEPFNNWTLYVEQEDNKGLLNKAAPLTIWKKNAIGSWGDYADMFGVPIRIGRTDVRDDKLRQNMENALANMGRLSYAVFDQDDTIELVQASGTDAFNVFMQLAEFCNKELSKLILGQTMTTDDGSSRSQSETHQHTMDGIIKADLRWLENYINSTVLPFLIGKHKFPLDGLKLKFDHTESLSLTDQMEMAKALFPHKDIPNDWILERFGIPVEDKANNINPADAENFFFEAIANCYNAEKTHKCNDIVNELEPKPVLTQAEQEMLFNLLYTQVVSTDNLSEPLYLGTVEQLQSAIAEGFGGGLKDFNPNTKEYKTLQAFTDNISKFAANKTFQNIAEMQSVLRDGDGVLKTFAEFKKDAGAIFDNYNKNYLKTEFNTALSNSQGAERWLTLQANKDIKPNVIYRTSGDSRVRDSHAALDGNIYSLDDTELSSIAPANDWNCRCFLEPTSTAVKNEIINKVNENINPLFAFNSGKDGVLFPPKHPYYKVPKKYKAAQKKNFGLPAPK